MRVSSRFLTRFLEPGTPTGLTGLVTHATPRSTLLSLYNKTLVNLKTMPETSLYRQSVEALTSHRMALVQAMVPSAPQPATAIPSQKPTSIAPQYGDVEVILATWTAMNEWELRPITEIATDGGIEISRPLATFPPSDNKSPEGMRWDWVGEDFVNPKQFNQLKEKVEAEYNTPAGPNGRLLIGVPGKVVERSDQSPQLTAEEISELEGKLGAGLIEEVIEAAEAELKLIDVMRKAQPWEPLEESPVPGQWKYFERGS